MTQQKTDIRLFGILHSIRKEQGLESVAQVHVPPEGRIARDVALELNLPLDKIEGIFINHVVHGIDEIIRPSDELAFVPTGIPGPHRYMLGIYNSKKG